MALLVVAAAAAVSVAIAATFAAFPYGKHTERRCVAGSHVHTVNRTATAKPLWMIFVDMLNVLSCVCYFFMLSLSFHMSDSLCCSGCSHIIKFCYCLHIVWPKSNAKCCWCSTKCIFDEYGDIRPIGRQWAREIVVIIISHKRIHSTAYVLTASHRYDGHQIGSKLQPYVWWLLTARIEKKDAFNEANIQEISIAIDGEAVWPNWTTLN